MENWKRVVWRAIFNAIRDIDHWNGLERELHNLSALHRKYPDIPATEYLPKEYSTAFGGVFGSLLKLSEYHACLIRHSMMAAPSMRRYFSLEWDSNEDRKSGRHKKSNTRNRRKQQESSIPQVFQDMSFLPPWRKGLKDKAMVENSPDVVKGIFWILDHMDDRDTLRKFDIQPFIDEFDREYAARPEFISPFVAREISSLGVLSECIRQMRLFRFWYSAFDSTKGRFTLDRAFFLQHNAMMITERYELPESLASLASPSGGRFDYPVDEPRTQTNMDKMSRALKELDTFWNALIADLQALNNQLSDPVLEVLAPGAWHIPPPWESSRAVPQMPQPQEVPGVSKKVTKVLNRLFSASWDKSSPPSTVAWQDFCDTMIAIGFTGEKLHGSAWHFTPKRAPEKEKGKAKRKIGIIFFEPPPGTKMDSVMLRESGLRLYKHYKMTKETALGLFGK